MKIMWQYNEAFLGVKNLVDPRIPIAKHLNWTPSVNTLWSQPEPDNFNASLFSSVPLEYPNAKHQVFYKDNVRNGWFSVYYIKPTLTLDWHEWFTTQPYWAKWYSTKHGAFRNKLTLLGNKPYRQTRDLSENERLYQMKYYEELKYKCVDSSIIDVRVGTPREGLVDLGPEPEVEDDDLL